jgi:hypothetical protein
VLRATREPIPDYASRPKLGEFHVNFQAGVGVVGLSFDFDIGYLLDNVGGIFGEDTSLGPLDRTGEDLVSERFEITLLLGPHVIACLGVEDRTAQQNLERSTVLAYLALSCSLGI